MMAMTAAEREQVDAVRRRLGWLDLRLVQRAVGQCQRAARRSARRSAKFVRSRGRVLATSATSVGQCGPYPEAEAPNWKGTRREIEQCVQLMTRMGEAALADEVYLAGGWDAADTMDFSDYEPRVAAWTVVVWTRSGGWCVEAECDGERLLVR